MQKIGSQGFTLIESMVTVTVIAVALLIGVPNLTAYRQDAELNSATNTLLAAINAARGEAMKRGMSAMVVPTDNGADWNAGWVVFVDTDRSRTYGAKADLTIFSQTALPPYINVTGNGTAGTGMPYMMFDSAGYSKTKSGGFGALTLTVTRNDLTEPALYAQTRRIVIASTGRVRTCKPASATDAACAGNMTK